MRIYEVSWRGSQRRRLFVAANEREAIAEALALEGPDTTRKAEDYRALTWDAENVVVADDEGKMSRNTVLT